MARNFLFIDERYQRAQWWPFMMWRFARNIWLCRHLCAPSFGLIETIRLANMHVHSWVWGHIEPDDVYLPTARMKKL